MKFAKFLFFGFKALHYLVETLSLDGIMSVFLTAGRAVHTDGCELSEIYISIDDC